jgi:DNA-directed RNA polymerase specialized sigma subunit
LDKKTKEDNENLIEHNLYLVLNELDKYPADKQEELFSIGLVGLIKAVNLNCNINDFIDAAKFQIKSEIRNYLRK